MRIPGLYILLIFSFPAFGQVDTIYFQIDDSDLDWSKNNIWNSIYQKYGKEVKLILDGNRDAYRSIKGDSTFFELFGTMNLKFTKGGILYKYDNDENYYVSFYDTHFSKSIERSSNDRLIRVNNIYRNKQVGWVYYNGIESGILEFICETNVIDSFPYILGFFENGDLAYLAFPNNQFYIRNKSHFNDEPTRITYWRKF